ncbi:hypothetical protein DH2020_025386 [Rehmannia glutinosa]|uniref:Uncharacterized protein n=1 Tax=Rehmannia glutinosa TaxID=99300 RepID=A0ABR0W460_REHGL
MVTVGHRELQWPGNYSTIVVRPRSNFLCDFHNEYGHTTEECRHLRNEIERIVRKGWLQNWVKQEHELRPGLDRSPNRQERPAEDKHDRSSAKPDPSRGTIHMIVEEPTDGDSNRDGAGNGDQTGGDCLFGFGGGMVEPLGQFTLPMSLGDLPMQKTRMVTFLVVDSYSTYNVIIGRPALNSFQAIVATFHMKLKFVVGDGVGEVLGNAQVARKCYVKAVRKGEQKKFKRKVVEMDKETKPIKIGKKERKNDPDLLSVRPEEELMMVELTPGDPSKVVKIGTKLGSELTKGIMGFLRENMDIFARSSGDLKGVDHGMVEHH